MSNTVVIRCINGSEDPVEFYDDEIPTMEIRHEIKHDIVRNDPSSPGNWEHRITYLSVGYMIITLNLKTYYKTTHTKLSTIAGWKTDNQPTPFKMYYEYAIDTDEFVWVQMKPETNKKYYSGGGNMPTFGKVNPVFVQSQPGGVAVLVSPKITGV